MDGYIYPEPSPDRPTGSGLFGQTGNLPGSSIAGLVDGSYNRRCYEAHLRYLARKSMFTCNYCALQFKTREAFNKHFNRCPIRIANGYIPPETPEEEMLVLTDENLLDEFEIHCIRGRPDKFNRRGLIRAELLKRLAERL